MSKEFEADVKKVKADSRTNRPKPKKEPEQKKSKERSRSESAKPEDSPLKTVGGTPIIERQQG